MSYKHYFSDFNASEFTLTNYIEKNYNIKHYYFSLQYFTYIIINKFFKNPTKVKIIL